MVFGDAPEVAAVHGVEAVRVHFQPLQRRVGEAAVAALKAGVDMLVIPGGRAQQDEAYRAVVAAVRSGAISAGRVVAALERIAALRRFTRETREPVRAAS